jgi:tetratricopeptide (TPR) repeat protein
MKRPPTYGSLMASAGIGRLSTDEAFLRTGILIDMCGAPRRKAGIARALAWCDELEARDLSAAERRQLDYFRANAWNTRRPRRRSGDVWLWDQPALQQEIFFLRRASSAEGFSAVEHYRRCEILTNLGNLLNHLGRSIEALEVWRRALEVDPEFWMARGNLGSGLARLGRLHYDRNQGAVMLLSAHKELARALGDAEKYPIFGFPEARAYFDQQHRDIEANVDLSAVAENFEPDGYAIGRSKQERQYRLWCLRHDLFLNLLNELGPNTVAAYDPLVLPSFVTKLGEPPALIGYFNQLKQEFVSARSAFFEGIQDGPAHLSDNGVLLINTLDYPSYGLGVEKIRTAYRTAYSLFDKMAFFLNHYMALGHADQDVSFRSVWRPKKGKGPRGILAALAASKNLSFRGLYWVSKDLFEEAFVDVADPDARALHELRIHLEHRYVKVHELMAGPAGRQNAAGDLFVDTLAYSVSRSDLEARTLRLLKLVRAALIYLCLGMHWEEWRRMKRRRSKRLIASQSLPTVEDRFKRKY